MCTNGWLQCEHLGGPERKGWAYHMHLKQTNKQTPQKCKRPQGTHKYSGEDKCKMACETAQNEDAVDLSSILGFHQVEEVNRL